MQLMHITALHPSSFILIDVFKWMSGTQALRMYPVCSIRSLTCQSLDILWVCGFWFGPGITFLSTCFNPYYHPPMKSKVNDKLIKMLFRWQPQSLPFLITWLIECVFERRCHSWIISVFNLWWSLGQSSTVTGFEFNRVLNRPKRFVLTKWHGFGLTVIYIYMCALVPSLQNE